MKRARRFPQRLVRWTSLCVCFALVLTSFVLFPSQVSIGKNKRSGNPSANSGAQGNGQNRRVAARPPQPGPPAGKLPNLDEMRSATDNARRHGARPVHAPQPVPSTGARWRHGAQRAATDAKPLQTKANHARTSRLALPEPQGTDDMAMARIDPYNRTGTGGVDLLSQNFNWSLGLVGLKGRGLDLGLALSYNSLATWTRSGNDVVFNQDQDTPSPGFRLGFPVVQGPYYNNLASTYFYLLITPSGQHVELRQISTYVFQAVDATYSQLTVNSGYLTFLSQGAQLTFYPNSGSGYHCTEVKDRNGNYISVSYNSSTGNISTVTDTLGRVITFNYDSYNNIQTITQPWGGATHTWASFGWGTAAIGSSIFSGKTYTGPTKGTSISVLNQVGLADGSKYCFDYDGSYAMVSAIKYYAPDDNPSGTRHERRQVTYGYDTSDAKVPRVNSEKDWAENWNGDTNGVPATDGSEEVTTTFSQSSGVGTMTLPDSTVYREVYGTGYQSGLVTMTKNYATTSAASSDSDSSPTWKKKTTTTWTQVDPSVSYLLNPRVTETNIYDIEGNRKRTTIYYGSSGGSYEQYSLPYLVQEYAADGSTVLRNTYTDYNLDSSYLNKRIIGLVSAVHVSDSSWQSKTTYDYDSTTIDSQAASTTHHDSAYSTSTVRGNVTKVWSWDVTDISNSSKAIRRSQITYDTAGSALSNTDALDHPNSITYASANYYAYPTTMSDAASNQSTVQYDFDTGAVTQTQGPPPSGQSAAMAQSMSYDSVGRLQWITRSDGFWKYIAYADSGDAVMSQVSLTAYPDSAWSITVVDGAGRTRLAGHDLPNSTGGYAGAFTHYDNMGRVSEQSNVEETNADWSPAGDDSAGWVYPLYPIAYDWKGRPTRTYNTDGTYKDASYGGCGCAGGAVVTLTDEVGRRQKVYSDSLGRQWKTEVLNSNSSVYSTSANTLNALDHVTQITQTDNATSVNQVTTMGYDGYGRLHTKHVPEQDSNTATTYTYNDDDTINSVTDARGASATYGYNSRRLVTGITYYAPSGVTSTPNVSFEYDAAGNKTSMTDGTGSVSYGYDTLSRVTSETRYISALSSYYHLSYGYNLSSSVTSVSESDWSQQVNYNYDSTGRVTSVTSSGYTNTHYTTYPTVVTDSVNTFVSSIAYRAWGAVKQMTYSNSTQLAMTFNGRLQGTQEQLTLKNGDGSNHTAGSTYDYYDDGKIRYAGRLDNNIFDRKYTYDQVGRIEDALTGAEARGGTTADGPFKLHFGYDGWSNTTTETSRFWTGSSTTINPSFSSNRQQYFGYDANGFVTGNYDNSLALWCYHEYDAAGKQTRFYPAIDYVGGQPVLETNDYLDGVGQPVKRVKTQRWQDPDTQDITTTTTNTYYLHSTALGGQLMAQLDTQGNKTESYVYMQGMKLATESIWNPSAHYAAINWQYTDPVTGSSTTTNYAGYGGSSQELDPLGADVTTPPDPPDQYNFQDPTYMNPKAGVASLIENQGFPLEPEIPGWYLSMANGWADLHLAAGYRSIGRRDLAQQVLANNPNIGIVVSGEGAGDLAGTMKTEIGKDGAVTFWGENAATALGFIADDNTVLIPNARLANHASGGDPQHVGRGGSKGCATPNSLVKQMNDNFEALWDRTSKSGEENGELVFYNQANNTYPEVKLSEGRHVVLGNGTQYAPVEARMELGPETEKALIAHPPPDNYFMAVFHTHPNTASGDSARGVPGWDDTNYQADHGNVLGIIRTKSGYSFYTHGRSFGPDDSRANNCIYDLNTSKE